MASFLRHHHISNLHVKDMETYLFLCLLLLASLFCTSCSPVQSTMKKYGAPPVIIEDISTQEKDNMRQQVAEGFSQGIKNYTINPGDVLELMYHITLAPQKDSYLLGVGDEVNVEFYYHPGMNRTVVVRPDGNITLPIKGDFKIAEITPAKSAITIKNKYSDIIKNPVVTVTVNKFSSKIFDLQKAITNSPRGQAKKAPVSPAGYVHLPLLKGVKASGKTIDAVEEEIRRLYALQFDNLDVSLLLESIVSNQIYVFGEVTRPGVLDKTHQLTTLQAIAQAGGLKGGGALDNVKVLMVSDNGQPVVRTVNLEKVLHNGSLEEDLLLPNNSVVFVPRTSTEKVGKWVDDYIRRIFMWNGSNFSLNYNLDNVRVQ